MLAGQGGRFLAATATLMVLARWLGPEPFGLLAMAELVTATALTIGGFGFGVAVVQRPTLDPAALGRLFRVNLGLSLVVYAGVVAGGVALAAFFGRPALVPLTALIGLGVMIDHAATLHAGLAHRRMRFGAVAAVEAGSVVLGCIAALIAARQHAGVWALALQVVVTLVARGVGLVAIAGPWPRDRGGVASARDPEYRAMLRYGGGHTLSRVIKDVSERLDQLVIGRFAGAASLGFYRNAQRWAWLPLQQLLSPLTTVATAGASRHFAAGDAAAYRRYVRRAAEGGSAIVVPAVVFSVCCAGPVVALVLGPDWAAAAPLLGVLSLGLLGAVPTMLLKVVMYAEGRLRPLVKINLMTALATVGGVAVGSAWGVVGVAWGIGVARCLAAAVAVAWGCHASPVRAVDLLAPIVQPLAVAAVAGLAARGCTPAIEGWVGPPFAALLLGPLFAALYVALSPLLPGTRRCAGHAWCRLRSRGQLDRVEGSSSRFG